MAFDIPVLLIAWRRPDAALKVVEALRKVSPAVVFFASDGWRNEEEKGKVLKTRGLVLSGIDWECEVRTLFREVNLGCEKGPSQAITWFFENVEYGIILEDDCVPISDFFYYCDELLKRYLHDERIWCISGSNFQNGVKRGSESYYFSRYNHGWGWATWSRCWRFYSMHLDVWDELKNNASFQASMFDDLIERKYWFAIWQGLFAENNKLAAWDYRWTLVILANSGLTIIPCENLVTNIGYGVDATHTFDPSISIESSRLSWPLSHPKVICRNHDADVYTFHNHFGGLTYKRSLSAWWNWSKRFQLLLVRPLHYPKKIFTCFVR